MSLSITIATQINQLPAQTGIAFYLTHMKDIRFTPAQQPPQENQIDLNQLARFGFTWMALSLFAGWGILYNGVVGFLKALILVFQVRHIVELPNMDTNQQFGGVVTHLVAIIYDLVFAFFASGWASALILAAIYAYFPDTVVQYHAWAFQLMSDQLIPRIAEWRDPTIALVS